MKDKEKPGPDSLRAEIPQPFNAEFTSVLRLSRNSTTYPGLPALSGPKPGKDIPRQEKHRANDYAKVMQKIIKD